MEVTACIIRLNNSSQPIFSAKFLSRLTPGTLLPLLQSKRQLQISLDVLLRIRIDEVLPYFNSLDIGLGGCSLVVDRYLWLLLVVGVHTLIEVLDWRYVLLCIFEHDVFDFINFLVIFFLLSKVGFAAYSSLGRTRTVCSSRG